MTKEDVYAILYLFDKEIRKSPDRMNFKNVFNPNAWPIALDRIDGESEFTKAGKFIHSKGFDQCIEAANSVTCNLISLKTLQVYIFGEYLRRNHGHFYKTKKDGTLQLRKGKKMFNKLSIDDFGSLKGIDLYKPSSLKSQTEFLKKYTEDHGNPLLTKSNETNDLYDLVCDGKIGLHIYLHLFKKNERFGIVPANIQDEDFKRFYKMVDYLNSLDIDLNDVYYHGR